MKNRKPPTIVTLGSSRVLQFRSNMFDVPFYNAGLAAMTLSDFKPFMQSIPKNQYPKYLIINLDAWMFNAQWDDLKIIPNENKWSKSETTTPRPKIFKEVWNDLINKKYTFYLSTHQDSIQRIGLNANLYNMGLRVDGSMCYGKQIDKLISGDSTAEDYNYKKTFRKIAQGNKRFEYGDTLNPKALIILDDFLSFCKQHSIQVTAFLPPYAEKVYAKMEETHQYSYLDKVYPAVAPILKKYDYEFYDYTHIEQFHSSDGETLDGFHGGEVTYLRLLIHMLESGSQLNEITNIERLKKDLKNRINNYTVYSY